MMKDRLISFCKRLFPDRIYGKVLNANVRCQYRPVVVGERCVVQRWYFSISGSVETDDDESISIKGGLFDDKVIGFGPCDLQPDDIIVGEGWRRGSDFLLNYIELIWRNRRYVSDEDGMGYVNSGHGRRYKSGH